MFEHCTYLLLIDAWKPINEVVDCGTSRKVFV